MSTYYSLSSAESDGASSQSPSLPRAPNPPHHGQAYPGGAYPPAYPPTQGYNQGPLVPFPQSRPQQSQGTDPTILANWRKFILNQSVQVNIQGHGWLVGTVVAIINAVKAISGSHVRVRYIEPRGYRENDFPNNPDYIRPYNPDHGRPSYD